MDRATSRWLSQKADVSDHVQKALKKLQRSYVIYGSMVLLPSEAISELQSHQTVSNEDLQYLYDLIAHQLKVTHIAVNQPIPLHSSAADNEENILRSPSNFTPLYGDFGPSTCSNPPTQADFNQAFWVTAKQNGIYQTWAPRWTMFSRGNISEKARLLTLPSVVEAVELGAQDGGGCAAVDLYVGIGYFAFSYAKAGVKKVVGWDLNPWSCEGLRRGAKANKWRARVLSDDDDAGQMEEAARDDQTTFLVFNESNEHAAARLERLRSGLPPIRHVNCGLLPTSKGSWEMALQALDERMGGWVHVHENFAVNKIEEKPEEVRVAFEMLLVRQGRGHRRVTVDNVNRLKSYAPGVVHCVLDIHLPPSTSPG